MDSILNFLGKDSGYGDNNNSAYVEINNKFILIDCGFSVFSRVKNFDLKKYDEICVIITHLHNDHSGSLSQFILYNWFVNNKKTTVISKCKNIKKYLEITGTNEEAYIIVDNYDSPYIEFIKTEHSPLLDSYGFVMKTNNKKIVYTGDTCLFDVFLPFIDGCDELYIDVSKNGGVHLKFEDIIGELRDIKKNGTKIFLMHIDDKKYIENVNQNEFFI